MDIAPYIKEQKELARLLNHMQAVREFFWTVVEIKNAIEQEDLFYAAQLWLEVPQEKQLILYGQSTKSGGIWTTKERAKIREAERLMMNLSEVTE